VQCLGLLFTSNNKKGHKLTTFVFFLNDKESEKIRERIQQVQADVINIPIARVFSPQQWRTVVNAMLEKVAGNPLLHNPRVIYILEADYNLARTLLQNEIINDYNKRLRINNFVGMTDISGCFDQILPPIISLLNLRNGCPREAVKMHANTLEKANYYLKTKQGVSTNFYSHSKGTQVYGNGQGAGDSPSQCSQESAMQLDLYEQQAPTAEMTFRDGTRATTIPTIAAFADDTNLFGNDTKQSKTKEKIVMEAKSAFETWNKLLHATGHFMELGKCTCYLSIWDFQDDGYAYTIPPEELKVQIKVDDINGRRQIIEQLSSETSQKPLGVMKNPIGNQQDEVARLKKKSNESPHCQLCNALEESNNHLLVCSSDIQENARMKIIDYIWRDNSNHRNSELNNIIKLAILESPHNSTWSPLAQATSDTIKQCVVRQSKIGWYHLIKGRITKEMRKTMDQHYQQMNVDTQRYTGERLCKLLIKNIWQAVLQL
jgi:hypothetical protein